MKFNINDTVRVRLTDYGRAALRGEFKPPKQDEDGWSDWQLWALMQAFGDRVNVGFPLCFETEIEIVNAPKEANS